MIDYILHSFKKQFIRLCSIHNKLMFLREKVLGLEQDAGDII